MISDVEKILDITQIIELIKDTQDKNRKKTHCTYTCVYQIVHMHVYIKKCIYVDWELCP